jgi:hypothetical protein
MNGLMDKWMNGLPAHQSTYPAIQQSFESLMSLKNFSGLTVFNRGSR